MNHDGPAACFTWPVNGTDQKSPVPARKITAPDRSAEEGIAREKKFFFREIIAGAPRRMAGSQNRGHLRSEDAYFLSVDKEHLRLRDAGMPEKAGQIKIHGLDEFLLFLHDIGKKTVLPLQFIHRSEMVIMPVRKINRDRTVFFFCQEVHNPVHAVGRINQQSFLRLPVADNIGIRFNHSQNKACHFQIRHSLPPIPL